MEDDKKGGNSASNPTFRVADIEGSKAGQQTDPFVNVRETAGGRIKKHHQRFAEWVGKHYKQVIIATISMTIVIVTSMIIVVVVQKQKEINQQNQNFPDQETTEQSNDIAQETEYTKIQKQAAEIFNNNPDNASAVVEFYKQLIDSALSKADMNQAYNLIYNMTHFFTERNLERTVIPVLEQLIEKLPENSDLKSVCYQRLYYLADRIGDEGLKNKYSFSMPNEQETEQENQRRKDEIRAVNQVQREQWQQNQNGDESR